MTWRLSDETCRGHPCICPPKVQVATVVHHIRCSDRHSHSGGICTFGDCPCVIPPEVAEPRYRPGAQP